MYDTEDTIVAIASAPGPAARGIVRVSGSDALSVIEQHFQCDENINLRAARSVEGFVNLTDDGSPLPVRLYLWPTNRSYTGQPTAELHAVGSPPLLQMLLTKLCQRDVRLAQPGEFTLRAFLAGRLDLPQAEAVLGVIDSVTEGQFDSALTQLSGGISKPLNSLRTRLLNLLADLEAGLDFVEEDIEFVSNDELIRNLSGCQEDIFMMSKQMESRTISNELPVVVLRGRPNAGKSTLWNALIDKQSAIVSDVPGTTRDYLEASLDLFGVQCRLIDTAGIEKILDPDSIEFHAQSATGDAVQSANVVVHCVDKNSDQTEWDEVVFEDDQPPIIAITKADDGSVSSTIVEQLGERCVITSGINGFGIDDLKRRILDQINRNENYECSAVASTAARSKESLAKAASSLQYAIEIAKSELGEELVAAEIRIALGELGKVVGAVYTDDILDRIFSRFCIGK